MRQEEKTTMTLAEHVFDAVEDLSRTSPAARIDRLISCLDQAGLVAQNLEAATPDTMAKLLLRRAISRLEEAAEDLRSLDEVAG